MVFEDRLSEVKTLIAEIKDSEAELKLNSLVVDMQTYVDKLSAAKKKQWSDTVSELLHSLEHFPYINSPHNKNPTQRENILHILKGIVVI